MLRDPGYSKFLLILLSVYEFAFDQEMGELAHSVQQSICILQKMRNILKAIALTTSIYAFSLQPSMKLTPKTALPELSLLGSRRNTQDWHCMAMGKGP